MGGMIGIRARITVPTLWVAAGVLASCSALMACSSDPPTDPCPGEVLPAFSVTVRAEDGPLPSDTRIRLAYGGGTQDYALGDSPPSQSVMFCQPKSQSGSAGASSADSVDELVCDLWVEGAATIRVNGGDYPEVSKELKGEANECGPETVAEELVLGGTDSTSGGE